MIFTVYETRAFHVDRCKEYQRQVSRGLYGCHWYTRCPNCQIVSEGIEYWGENGHNQGRFAEPVSAEYAVRRGWRVLDGGKTYYQGSNL